MLLHELNSSSIDLMSVNQNYNKNFIVKTDGTWDPSCELQPVPSSRTFSAYIFAQVFRAKIRPKSKSKKKNLIKFYNNNDINKFLQQYSMEVFKTSEFTFSFFLNDLFLHI